MSRFPKTGLSEGLHKHETKLRFVVVGAWNTLFGYFVFVLLDEIFSSFVQRPQIAYMSALVLANVIAVLNAFALHRHFTFRSKVRGLAVLGELVRFSSTYLFTFLLSLVLLPAFVEVCGFSARLAGAVVILVCTVISYLGHSRFSFRNASS